MEVAVARCGHSCRAEAVPSDLASVPGWELAPGPGRSVGEPASEACSGRSARGPVPEEAASPSGSDALRLRGGLGQAEPAPCACPARGWKCYMVGISA